MTSMVPKLTPDMRVGHWELSILCESQPSLQDGQLCPWDIGACSLTQIDPSSFNYKFDCTTDVCAY